MHTRDGSSQNEEKERVEMKNLRLSVAALLVVVAALLAGCEVYIHVGVEPFERQNATYSTNYTYEGSYVVCDDRTTQFGIILGYRGEIEYVTVSLVGAHSGERYVLGSFSPSASENDNGAIRRTFNVRRGLSPLEVAVSGTGFGESSEPISSQSIIVVPIAPEIIGYTSLEVRIETGTGDRTIGSQSIPVFRFCG